MKYNQQDFYDHLDGATPKETDAETQAMMAMLQEVEALETPDPGAEYWNQFNGEFQQRLAKAEAKQPWYAKWTRLAWMPLAAASALALVLYIALPTTQKSSPDTAEMPTLASLSQESLAALEQFYLPEQDDFLVVEDSYSNDLDADALWQSYEVLYEEDSYNLQDLETEQLESIWNLEG